MNELVDDAKNFHAKVNVLHDEGVIKQEEDGSLIVVDDPEERQARKEESASKKKMMQQQISSMSQAPEQIPRGRGRPPNKPQDQSMNQ